MSISFDTLPHPGIQSLKPYQPGKSIEALQQETNLNDIIKLASNENPLGCSPHALSALQQLPSITAATYPSYTNHPIISKLAQKLNIKTQQLVLGNGSDTIFGLLTTCFALHTNKHILTHDYAFSTYAIQAHTLGIPVRTVPTTEHLEVDIHALINACTNDTALIFIANPNNPTGLLMSQDSIKELLQRIPSHTLLVLDEAYYEYARSQQEYSSLEWLAHYPNLVITRTFSKIYGMAGLRLGYAMAHPDIVRILIRAQLPFVVNQVALHAGEAALDDDAFITQSLQMNALGMRQMKDGFDALNISYLPSAGNFLTCNIKEDGMKLYHYLLQCGIIIRPLHPYNLSHYLRVTVGTKEQNARFLEALNHYLNR